MERIGRNIRRGLAAMSLAALAAGVAHAAGNESSLLPIKVGAYFPGTPAQAAASRPDCGGPEGLGWSGHSFDEDYVYIDNIVEVKKLADGAHYLVKSETRMTDEGGRPLKDKIWFAEIKVISPDEFLFKQYSAKESPSHETFQHYAFCKR